LAINDYRSSLEAQLDIEEKLKDVQNIWQNFAQVRFLIRAPKKNSGKK